MRETDLKWDEMKEIKKKNTQWEAHLISEKIFIDFITLTWRKKIKNLLSLHNTETLKKCDYSLSKGSILGPEYW